MPGLLDRSLTSPSAMRDVVDDDDDADQTLREYRIRKAAREEARRRTRSLAAAVGDDEAYTSSLLAASTGNARYPVMPPPVIAAAAGASPALSRSTPPSASGAASRTSTRSQQRDKERMYSPSGERADPIPIPVPVSLLQQPVSRSGTIASSSSSGGNAVLPSRRGSTGQGKGRGGHASAPPLFAAKNEDAEEDGAIADISSDRSRRRRSSGMSRSMSLSHEQEQQKRPDVTSPVNIEQGGSTPILSSSSSLSLPRLQRAGSHPPTSSQSMAATTAQRTVPLFPRSSHAASQDLGGDVEHVESQLPSLEISGFSSRRYGPAAAEEERKDSNVREIRRTSAHTFGNPFTTDSLPGSPTGSIIDHEAGGGADAGSAAAAVDDAQEEQEQAEEAALSPTSSAVPESLFTPLSSSSDGPVQMHIASRSSSSSLLPAQQQHQQPRQHQQPQQPRDDSAYGIPCRVMVDGQWIDIRDLDILDQVEMIRQAKKAATLQEQERKMQSQQHQQQGGHGEESGEREKRSTREVLEAMNYTELSDIAERTECSTYSRRTSIAPTVLSSAPSARPSRSAAVQPQAFYGTQSLSPAPGSPVQSLQSSTSEIKGTAASMSERGREALSKAEKIKLRYYHAASASAAGSGAAPAQRQSAGDALLPVAAAAEAGEGREKRKKYMSVGETVYHSTSQPSLRKTGREKDDDYSKNPYRRAIIHGSAQSPAVSGLTHYEREQKQEQKQLLSPSKASSRAKSPSELSYSSQTSAYLPKKPKMTAILSPSASWTSDDGRSAAGSSISGSKSGTGLSTNTRGGKGVHPLSGALSSHEAGSGGGNQQEGQERAPSPMKRALSPAVALRAAAFSNSSSSSPAALAAAPTPAPTGSGISASSASSRSGSPVKHSASSSVGASAGVRERAKSFGSSIGVRTGAHTIDPRSRVQPPLPTMMPTSRSAGELVKMYELRSGAAAPGGSAEGRLSPVKDWLKKVPVHSDSRPVSPLPSPSLKTYRAEEDDGMNTVSGSAAGMTSSQSAPSILSMASSPREHPPLEEAPTSSAFSAHGHRKYFSEFPAHSSSSASSASGGSTHRQQEEQKYNGKILHHGEVFWLNSSSKTRPPFWQPCKAVLVTSPCTSSTSTQAQAATSAFERHELVISWPGSSAGSDHLRRFELDNCLSAVSIRRNTHLDLSAGGEKGTADAAEKMRDLQVFELQWAGRTHRFGVKSSQIRMKWLGWIFQIISSNAATATAKQALPPSAAALAEQGTEVPDTPSIGSATLRSLDVHLREVEGASTASGGSLSSAASYTVPMRPRLEMETQASLYASVSEMLSPSKGSQSAAELPDIPRYQLRDTPIPSSTSGSRLSGPRGGGRTPTLPPKTVGRGAWSETDRQSTQSDARVLHTTAIGGGGTVLPTRVIARDVKRLLGMMERHASRKEGKEGLEGMKEQLENISNQLREQGRVSIKSKKTAESMKMADKMDEIMGLLVKMAEDKKDVNTAARESAVSAEHAAELQKMKDQMAYMMEKFEAAASATSSPETTRQAVPPLRDTLLLDPSLYSKSPSYSSITPSILAEDLEADAAQWAQSALSKRNSVLPSLPAKNGTPSFADKNPFFRAAAAAAQQHRLTIDSSLASPGRIYNEREDAAAKLEGTHPELVYRLDGPGFEGRDVPSHSQRKGKSAWSPDTTSAIPAEAQQQVSSKMPSLSSSAKQHRKVSKPLPTVVTPDESVTSSASSRSDPPTPKARDFKRKPSSSSGAREPDAATKELCIQMKTMHELLMTLIAGQARQSEILTHQQQVSDYITSLHEFLGSDREMRKGYHKETVDSFAAIGDQLKNLPKEIQTLVQASIAIAGVQNAHAAEEKDSPPQPPSQDAPAPDTDGNPAPPRPQTKPPVAGSNNVQAKDAGASLLRKVSLGLSGGAPGGPGGIKVAGPRKIGGPRLFGHPPAATTDEARNRWNTGGSMSRRQREAGAPPALAADEQAYGDPQAPLMAALQGFEEQIAAAEDAGEETDDKASVIARGIMEILKMMKAQQARDEAKDQHKLHRREVKEHLGAEKHARELESIRMEIREWQAKMVELQAKNRDPVNEEGILTIIALLKDQMAQQEALMADMKESVTPKLSNLDEESKQAMHDMKEHMLDNLDAFRAKMDAEVKKTLEEVSALREQKKALQGDLSDLLAFKAKYAGGAPEGVGQPRVAAPAARHPGPGPPGYPAPTPDNSGPFMRARGPR